MYHGCAMGYKDGTRIPIKGKCVLATVNPFWKRAEDIQNKANATGELFKSIMITYHVNFSTTAFC